jgi:PAS domain S-box-containing protein
MNQSATPFLIHAPLFTIVGLLIALAVVVLRARPQTTATRWFFVFTITMAGWTAGIALVYAGVNVQLWGPIAFASASLSPASFIAFINSFPTLSTSFPPLIVRAFLATAGVLGLLCVSTHLVVSYMAFTLTGFARTPGPLYPAFVFYFLASFATALMIFMRKWSRASGLARVQLQYLGFGIFLPGAGAIASNLLAPLFTGKSTYSWLGPYFALLFVGFVAHAIIRHRLMDLRIIIHRGLTLALAIATSLVPVGLLLVLFWPQLAGQLQPGELLLLLVLVTVVGLLIPPTRDIAGRLLDRYVYRTRLDYQRTIRETSRALTRVLDLKIIAALVGRAGAVSSAPEGIAIYLKTDDRFSRFHHETRQEGVHFSIPDEMPQCVVEALADSRDLLMTEELPRAPRIDRRGQLHEELTGLNWALVLPLLSEDVVIGAIVMGPKLSGDPFYPQDLDLLMTLANQAGIAVKNAQLYTEVVLAREYVENIVATIESGVVAIDAGGRIAMFNRAAEQLTGLRAEAIKRQPVDLLPAELVGPLRATIADGQGQIRPEIALPDGTTTRPVICTTSALRDPAGTILGAVAVFSDLTPLKQLERERGRAERLAYFEILASSLAHEIKNPLVAIKTFAQLIPRRHRDEQFVQEFSRVVTREIGQMERLLDRLRALSRSSDRPKQPIDLREPLHHALELLRPAFDEKRITLGVTLASQPGLVLADPSELEQLFHNLLVNAHEATPPEGTVAVELGVGGQEVVVTIADSGPGIPPELLEHVFDPFITTKPRGSGLGLTISAGIARTHQATLRADNRPDGGARFTVVFPVATPPLPGTEVRGTGRNGMNTRG